MPDSFNNLGAVNTRIEMPANPDVLNLLRRLGLNQYEAKAYFALSTTGKNTAGELSERAELPRPRVYDVLSSLQNKGFVAVQPGRPVTYSSLPIDEAVKTLKKQRQSELTSELTKIDEVGGDLATRISEFSSVEKPTVEDNVWTLKGRDAIYSKMASMFEDAKRHVLVASSADGARRKFAEHGRLLEKAKNRGVKITVVSPVEKSRAAEITKVAKLHQYELPTRFVLSDDQALLFLTPEGTEPDDELGIWVNSPHFANTLRQVLKE